MKIAGVLCVILLLLIFVERNQVLDLSSFESDKKSIEIKGEVKSPGVYEVKRNASVEDVIKLAGGITLVGDTSQINLSKDIEQHGIIMIQKKQQKELVSINSASIEELDTLKGIGPSIAQRIIDYRQLHSFQSLDDLKEVKGIGDKLFEKIKAEICL